MVKNLPAMRKTQIRFLGQEDPPGEGHGNPLQYSCLENSMDRRAWQAAVHGVAKSWTRLSNSHFHQCVYVCVCVCVCVFTFPYLPPPCLKWQSPPGKLRTSFPFTKPILMLPQYTDSFQYTLSCLEWNSAKHAPLGEEGVLGVPG